MTYPTWLDWYCAGALDDLAERIPKRDLPATDREAQFLLSIAGVQHFTEAMQRGDTRDDTIARHVFLGAVTAFTAPQDMPDDLGFSKPAGIKLSPRLARDLSRAHAPDTPDWLAELRRATWYIDVPHSCLIVGQHQVRAIFTQPTPSAPDHVAGVLILTHLGSDDIAGRFAWMIAGGNEDQLRGSADTAIDYDAVRGAATDFLALVLLYHRQIAQDVGRARDLWIPMHPHDALAKLPRKKQKARQKTHSLFRIRELYEPADRFGRTDTTVSGNPWHLDHRVRVRGHFRWQAHGTERRLRKLIWIDAHERGPEIDKPLLDSLRRKHQ